jgi:hypothetical protein
MRLHTFSFHFALDIGLRAMMHTISPHLHAFQVRFIRADSNSNKNLGTLLTKMMYAFLASLCEFDLIIPPLMIDYRSGEIMFSASK